MRQTETARPTDLPFSLMYTPRQGHVSKEGRRILKPVPKSYALPTSPLLSSTLRMGVGGVRLIASVPCSPKRRLRTRTAPGPPRRNRAGAFPPPPLHFEFIAQPAAQGSLGAGDFLSLHKADFLALAKRDISTYLGKLLEAVPLASGFAPKQFVSEPLGRTFHWIRIYKSHHETLYASRSRTSSRWQRSATLP
jgi:hypothetical protein